MPRAVAAGRGPQEGLRSALRHRTGGNRRCPDHGRAIASPPRTELAVQPPATEVPAGHTYRRVPGTPAAAFRKRDLSGCRVQPGIRICVHGRHHRGMGGAGAALPPAAFTVLGSGAAVAALKPGPDVPLAGTRLAESWPSKEVTSVTAFEAEPSGDRQAVANAVMGYTAIRRRPGRAGCCQLPDTGQRYVAPGRPDHSRAPPPYCG